MTKELGISYDENVRNYAFQIEKISIDYSKDDAPEFVTLTGLLYFGQLTGKFVWTGACGLDEMSRALYRVIDKAWDYIHGARAQQELDFGAKEEAHETA